MTGYEAAFAPSSQPACAFMESCSGLVVARPGRFELVRLPGNHRGYATGPADRLLASPARGRAGHRLPLLPLRRRAAAATRAFPSAAERLHELPQGGDRVARRRPAAEASGPKAEGRDPRPIISPELRKLYRALGLNDARERDPSG